MTAEEERKLIVKWLIDADDDDADALDEKLLTEIISQHKAQEFCTYPFFKLFAEAIAGKSFP